MEIRLATPSDAREIAQIQVRTWQHAYHSQIPESYLSSLSVEEKEKKWKESLSKSNFPNYVVVEDGKIKGFVNGGRSKDEDAPVKTGELYAIYVDHNSFGKGFGSALEKQIIATLKDQGFRTATLWVLESNHKARKFYESKGWSLDGKKKIDKRDGFDLHEVRYRKDLY